MTSTTTTPAPRGTRHAFCPDWCASSHSDDYALDLASGLPVVVHVSIHGTPAAAYAEARAWISREDLIEAGEGVRLGEVRIETTSDASEGGLTADAARALGAELIALADSLDATEDHR